MTVTTIFEPAGRAIPFAVEGEGPVSLVLFSDSDLETDGLAVISHYLVEEAGFHVVRIGSPAHSPSLEERVEGAVAVLSEISLEHTWVGGHGAGGAVARSFAGSHTERTNGLLLLGVDDDERTLPPLMPVLIIQGSEDEVTPRSNGERLQATAPERASVKNLDGAGHHFPRTHPIQTAFIIEEYLDWD